MDWKKMLRWNEFTVTQWITVGIVILGAINFALIGNLIVGLVMAAAGVFGFFYVAPSKGSKDEDPHSDYGP